MLQLEVLVGELGVTLAPTTLAGAHFLAVDRLPAGAVSPGEVTALEHEFGDDAVEGRALVAEALLASAQRPEVLSRLGNDVGVKVEVDAGILGCLMIFIVSPS